MRIIKRKKMSIKIKKKLKKKWN